MFFQKYRSIRRRTFSQSVDTTSRLERSEAERPARRPRPKVKTVILSESHETLVRRAGTVPARAVCRSSASRTSVSSVERRDAWTRRRSHTASLETASSDCTPGVFASPEACPPNTGMRGCDAVTRSRRSRAHVLVAIMVVRSQWSRREGALRPGLQTQAALASESKSTHVAHARIAEWRADAHDRCRR